MQCTRVLHVFYDSDPGRGFYGGGGIDARIDPVPLGTVLYDMPAHWGAPLKRALRDLPRTMLAMSHTTSLALERNSVSIDPELKDAWGVPAMRVTYNFTLFQYRYHGADFGRVLMGFDVPDEQREAFEDFLARVERMGYPHVNESDNPAYKMFLGWHDA